MNIIPINQLVTHGFKAKTHIEQLNHPKISIHLKIVIGPGLIEIKK
jgi:hypothetical protein